MPPCIIWVITKQRCRNQTPSAFFCKWAQVAVVPSDPFTRDAKLYVIPLAPPNTTKGPNVVSLAPRSERDDARPDCWEATREQPERTIARHMSCWIESNLTSPHRRRYAQNAQLESHYAKSKASSQTPASHATVAGNICKRED